MSDTKKPNPVDLLSVRSRLSWGSIAAGAMVTLTLYVILTMFGVALGVELAVRGSDVDLGAGAAIYSIGVLLVSMFFGGWTTSRLAVGETKLEAVLYGLILWGVVFLGMVGMVSSGMRTGFTALFGSASGAYATNDGRIDIDHISRDLKDAGIEEATVNKYRDYYNRVRANPSASVDVGREIGSDARTRQAARMASWWSLAGMLISLTTTVFGSLAGSGEIMQPVPLLGVRRPTQRTG